MMALIMDNTSTVAPANITTSLPDYTDVLNATSPEAEKSSCQLFQFILYFVLGVLCLFGFTGNLVSFLVLHKDKSSIVASFLLKTLALADNSFLVLWTAHYTVRHSCEYFEVPLVTKPGWLYFRAYTFPIMYMAQMATIWLTVVIALNRFMAVCLPYRAPTLCTINNVYKQLICVTIFSIAYNIPRFLELRITTFMENGTTRTAWNYTELAENKVYQFLYSHSFYYMFTFVLPVLILTVVNTKVIIAYRATRQRRYRMTSRRNENESNITLVMIIVVVIFMICQAPARIVQIVTNYRFKNCMDYQFYLIHISNTLEVLNSSINFVVYFLFRKRFRDILKESLCINAFSRARSNSRFTTTEGLSLVEIEKTNLSNTGSQREKPVPPENNEKPEENANHLQNNQRPLAHVIKADEQLELVQNQV